MSDTSMVSDDVRPDAMIPDALFRLLLDCYMQADPHPWNDEDDGQLTHYLDEDARARGYESWVEAYHQYRVGT